MAGDLGNGLQSTAAGAATGAAAGSVVPGIGTAIGAAAGGIISGIGSLFGGGSQTQQGYTLPPAYEAQLLSYFDQSQNSMQGQMSQLQQIMGAYQQKIQTLDAGIQGTMPPAQMTQALAQSNMQLAQSLGMSGQDLVKNGFMSSADAQTVQQMQDLTNQGNMYTDPSLQNQLQDQRRQLDQNLTSQGASPATRAQALAQFDRSAQEQMFQRSQDLKTTQSSLLSNTLQASLGAKMQGFNMATNSLQAGQGQIGQVQQGLGLQAGLAQQGLQGMLSGQQQQQNIMGAQGQLFNQLGQFKLSSLTSSNLKPGATNAYIPQNQFATSPNFNYTAGYKNFSNNPTLTGLSDASQTAQNKATAPIVALGNPASPIF